MKTCTTCFRLLPLESFYKQTAPRTDRVGKCKSCTNKRSTKWQQENRDRMSAIHTRFRKNHLDRYAAYARDWRERNPEQSYQITKNWVSRNRDKNREHTNTRRARKIQAAGFASADQIKLRWAMWGNNCWMCGEPATATDHVIPLSRGGSNWPSNLRPSCKSCNSRKGVKRVLVGS